MDKEWGHTLESRTALRKAVAKQLCSFRRTMREATASQRELFATEFKRKKNEICARAPHKGTWQYLRDRATELDLMSKDLSRLNDAKALGIENVQKTALLMKEEKLEAERLFKQAEEVLNGN